MQRNFSQVLTELDSLFKDAQNQDEHQSILEAYKQLPFEVLVKSKHGLEQYALVLAQLQHVHELEFLLQHTKNKISEHDWVILNLTYARALQDKNHHPQAIDLLKAILPKLQGEARGNGWVSLGRSLFETNQENWEDAFEQGLLLLHRLDLARAFINYGYCLSQKGFQHQAQKAWIKALALVQKRVKTKALILYNLASSTQKELQPLADDYWQELEQVTRNPKAKDLRAAALNGLGMQIRTHGEWARAEFFYLQARECAKESSDLKNAYYGLARVYELSNRPLLALGVLEEAFHNQDLAHYHNQFLVAKASALLAQNDLQGAKACLEQADEIMLDSLRWLFAFAKAELARREGREMDAVKALEAMPNHILHAREEATRFPELCVLLEKNGLTAPKPLEYVQGLKVYVEATHVLKVSINQRTVKLPPTGKIAELLVYLLEHGGTADTSSLMDILYPQQPVEKARKRLWDLAQLLEQTLGWKDSVQNLFKVYQLDPNATWQYDINTAREKGYFRGSFLKGIDNPWVDEVRDGLKALEK